MISDQTDAIERFRTTRLVALRPRPDDLGDLCAMHRNRRVMAPLGGIRAKASTRDDLADSVDHWDRYGYGLWIIRDTAGGFVGRAGIRHVTVGQRSETALIYSLMPEFWRRGLATELALALLEIGFARLRLSNVVAFMLINNWPSRRIVEKIGFQFERALSVDGLPHVLYRMRSTGIERVRANNGSV